jgi:cyclophilin family peptidyl-prolyl cis-trans isomerase
MQLGSNRMPYRRVMLQSAVVMTLVFLLIACGEQTKTKDFDAEDSVDGAEVKKGVKPQADEEVAVIETDYGNIVIELYPNIAPRMVERFKKLISEGFYNGTTFHRIDPRLGIIQGGDPLSRDDDPRNDGSGSSNEPNLPAEFSDLLYERGAVGAARGTAADSANSQFFITLKRQPAFDQRYTVFGRVIEGINNADVISTAPIDPGTESRPADKVVINRITLRK